MAVFYISQSKLLTPNEVFDASGKMIFPNLPRMVGRLMFVDLMPDANWAHRCVYLFASDEPLTLERCDGDWPPCEGIDMVLVH